MAVLDKDGNLLLGRYPKSGNAQELTLNGNRYGMVLGDKADVLAKTLRLFLHQEHEKRVVARETLDRYKEITLLYGIAEKIASNMNPLEVGELLLKQALHLIKADNASVVLVDEDFKLTELASAGCAKGKQRHRAVVGATGIAASIIAQGKAEIVNDVNEDERFVADASTLVSSLMCAPLKVKNKVIGVINVSTEQPHTYTADELKLLSSLAIQVAAVIENARLYDQLQDTFLSTVNVLAETIEMRDQYTGGHTRRVRDFSLSIGARMGLDNDEMDTLYLAASLHDIGKIGIDDHILRKPGRLTSEEFEQIKRHSQYGGEILMHVNGLRHVVPIVRGHHERYDGTGYPDALKGEAIPKLARIISVADTLDAMISHRPYRKALPLDAVLRELEKNKGTQFDPRVVEAFFTALQQEEIKF